MTHWNYRVIEFAAANEEESARRELREVYYDDTGKPSSYGAIARVAWNMDEDPATPLLLLERMREALGKPVLADEDFESKDQAARARLTRLSD